MALKAGTIADFTNSMAKAIEDAFIAAWPDAMGTGTTAPTPNAQMQLLYVAIAQGVINHLAAHPEAFVIDATLSGTTITSSIQQITTS